MDCQKCEYHLRSSDYSIDDIFFGYRAYWIGMKNYNGLWFRRPSIHISPDSGGILGTQNIFIGYVDEVNIRIIK